MPPIVSQNAPFCATGPPADFLGLASPNPSCTAIQCHHPPIQLRENLCARPHAVLVAYLPEILLPYPIGQLVDPCTVSASARRFLQFYGVNSSHHAPQLLTTYPWPY